MGEGGAAVGGVSPSRSIEHMTQERKEGERTCSGQSPFSQPASRAHTAVSAMGGAEESRDGRARGRRRNRAK